jgi:hypothetical protein
MAKQLKFGNGEWYGADGSILAYNDLNDNYKPLPFNFERGSSATRVNKEGLIELVGGNQPRVDYLDSEDGVFLLEKEATNLITYSEDFDNSYWTKSGASVTSGFVSPDGTNNAFKLVEDTSTGIHQLTRSITNTVANQYSISVFVKENTRNWIRLSSGDGGYVFFNISDNTIGIQTNAVGVIEDIGNGWKRCKITFTAAGTNGSATLRIAESDGVVSYVGQNKSVYVYGMQYEQGSYATSYIPTQGSAQTRVAEAASGSGNSEVFNDSEGVLFANIAANADDLTQRALGLSDGTSSNRMSIVYNDGSSNALRMFVSNPSGTKSYITNSFNITQNNKISIKLNGTSLAFWVNGFEIHTDALNSAFVNGTLDTFDFAFFDNNTPFYGKTKEIGYYDEILTDLELETLTSYRTWESMVKELNLNVIYNG